MENENHDDEPIKITAQTLKNFGVTADIVAKEFTINGLVEAIQKFYKEKIYEID